MFHFSRGWYGGDDIFTLVGIFGRHYPNLGRVFAVTLQQQIRAKKASPNGWLF